MTPFNWSPAHLARTNQLLTLLVCYCWKPSPSLSIICKPRPSLWVTSINSDKLRLRANCVTLPCPALNGAQRPIGLVVGGAAANRSAQGRGLAEGGRRAKAGTVHSVRGRGWVCTSEVTVGKWRLWGEAALCTCLFLSRHGSRSRSRPAFPPSPPAAGARGFSGVAEQRRLLLHPAEQRRLRGSAGF